MILSKENLDNEALLCLIKSLDCDIVVRFVLREKIQRER